MLEKLPGLKDFFPHYDEDYLPQKDFFWTVFRSAYPKECKQLIDEAMKLKAGDDEENGDMIAISQEFLKEMQEYHYKPGRPS